MNFKQIIFLLIFITIYAESLEISNNTDLNLKNIISTIMPLREDGKIYIPAHIQHVKLDIGLSYSAPMSQQWLSHENNLIVFGFEPNPACVESIKKGAKKWHYSHGEPLDPKYIGSSFFLIPCALGLSKSPTIKFNVTTDCGCSSIYPPKFFSIERVIEVPIFSLADFFSIFPFDTHPVIDYIKIDAQGSDLDIVKSAEDYLEERVIFITLEPENNQYANTTNSINDIDAYMKKKGFIRYHSSFTQDPTYFNPRFTEYVQQNPVSIFQKG